MTLGIRKFKKNVWCNWKFFRKVAWVWLLVTSVLLRKEAGLFDIHGTSNERISERITDRTCFLRFPILRSFVITQKKECRIRLLQDQTNYTSSCSFILTKVFTQLTIIVAAILLQISSWLAAIGGVQKSLTKDNSDESLCVVFQRQSLMQPKTSQISEMHISQFSNWKRILNQV